jgi:hypothetical protein
MRKKIAEFVKAYGLALAVAAMVFLVVVDYFFLPTTDLSKQQNRGMSYSEEILLPQGGFAGKTLPAKAPKLSEMKGPKIDDEGISDARTVNRQNYSCQKMGVNSALPVEAWIFLLAAYLFLLIFNLGITFGKRKTIQWVWEAIITVLALLVWFWQDVCRANLWYPLFVISLGVLIYIFYLYFFNEDSSRNLEEEKKA